MNYRETGADKAFSIVNITVLTLLFVLVLYPLVYVISASFSSATAIIQGRVVLFPVEFGIEGYKAVFSYDYVLTGYKNSFINMTLGTSLNIVMTVMIAYPLSRSRLIGKRFISLMLVFTMIFNAGLIPNYLLVSKLGLMDTRGVLIIPKALNVWNVMITITYFKTTIPKELLEASQIDGCDDFKFIQSVVLPLSKPIIAVITLFYAVEHWNSYFDAMIYIKSSALKPLQIVLRDILVASEISLDMISSIDPKSLAAKENLATLLKYALIIVSSLPLMMLYPFIQKHFVKGIMVGSVKG